MIKHLKEEKDMFIMKMYINKINMHTKNINFILRKFKLICNFWFFGWTSYFFFLSILRYNRIVILIFQIKFAISLFQEMMNLY